MNFYYFVLFGSNFMLNVDNENNNKLLELLITFSIYP